MKAAIIEKNAFFSPSTIRESYSKSSQLDLNEEKQEN